LIIIYLFDYKRRRESINVCISALYSSLTPEDMGIIANQILNGTLEKRYLEKIKLLSSKFTSSSGY
jgi:hypothetical protein